MGIIEEIEKRASVQPVKSLAQKLYDKQVSDITNISHLDWYKEVKAYWQRVQEWASDDLKIVTEVNLKITQQKYKIASDFITFLSNLESTKETRAKVQKEL